jgi:hypothetical protein
VKVWDKREFKDLDDSVELGTRDIKVALRRLRGSPARAPPRSSISPGTIGRPRATWRLARHQAWCRSGTTR